MQKDEILERLVFSDGVVEAYAKTESTSKEPAGDHWSRPVLLERAAYLRKLARFSEGSASETIREFSGYSLMLVVLLRSDDPAIHETYGCTLTVLDGRAKMLTGGIIERTRRVGTGEIKGLAISGGAIRELYGGDVVHLPPGTPHQLLLTGDQTLSYLLLRVRENAQPDSPS